MLLVEIVMQGVGPFSGTTKIDLKGGLNLVIGGNESGKTTIYNCLFSFLDIKHADSKCLVNWDEPETSRAALIFKSRDGETYKVVQDYLKGQVAVFKFNPSSERFDLLDRGEAWLKEFLRSESEGLETEDIEQVFGLQYGALLSISAQANNGSKSAPAVSAWNDKGDVHLKEKRLKELKEALKKGEELSQLEYQMDEVQNKIDNLNKKLRDFKAVEERLEAVSRELGELKDFAVLSADVPELVSAYEKREQERGDGLRRFEEELLIQEEELARIPSNPLYKNKTFLIGGGIAILSNIIIFSVNLPAMVQPLYWVAFLAGVGMLGYTIFKELQVNTIRSEKEERGKALHAEMRKFVRRYERENAPFLELLKKTSSQNAADLRRGYGNYRELLEMRRGLEEKRGHVLEGVDKKTIEDEHQSLQTRRKELHEKISGYAGMSTNLYEIKEEIERIETELSSHGIKTGDTRADEAITGGVDADPPFLDIKKILKKDFARLFQRIREEARRIMERLSLGRYEQLDIDEDSRVFLHIKGKGKKITPSMLSPGAIAQIYLSMRLAIFSALSSRATLPFIFDNPLILLDPSRQLSAVELLREMGKDNQIILLSGHSYPVVAGDHLVQL